MSIFKGIVLAQHKEPAFSRPLVRFVNPQTEALTIDREPVADIAALTVDDVIDIAKSAQIVDERDGKMLYRKLLRAMGRAACVIADAVDDEPYVSSQINPMMKLKDEAVGGLKLCSFVCGCDNVFILAYKNITDIETRIPRSIDQFKVVRLRGGYPAESRSLRLGLGERRRLIVGAGALIHLYRAVIKRKRQSTVFITVAGNCVANPMNLEASIGMTVIQVLERCGMIDEPTRIVCGGPMTGISVINAEKTLITYTTRAVLAFRESAQDKLYTCIGCARCERVCPSKLNPMYIKRFVDNSYFAHLKPFDAHLCIGCGTCSYSCLSKLDVSASVAEAKRYAIEHFGLPIDDEEADKLES
ncbi:MAG: SLBB domain-containing protein [Oscillospiraceae bacterium]|nr:SLBB domain-containing protein [Oscillospiraceae bacterium]